MKNYLTLILQDRPPTKKIEIQCVVCPYKASAAYIWQHFFNRINQARPFAVGQLTFKQGAPSEQYYNVRTTTTVRVRGIKRKQEKCLTETFTFRLLNGKFTAVSRTSQI